MSTAQRLAVWNGEREKTTGGLHKKDLIKNRHGRIVSKRKSAVARKLNNLGRFLAGGSRTKGDRSSGKKTASVSKTTKKAKQKKTRRENPKKAVEQMTGDPEVKAKRKKILKRKSQVSPDVDVANVIPKMDEKRGTRKSGRRRKRVDYSKMGGTLVTPSQLEKAKRKPVPRRRRKTKKNADPVLDTIHI